MRLAIVLATLCCCKSLCGQQSTRITGQLMEKGSDAPISNAIITLENTSQEFATDSNGEFEINVSETGEQILRISALDFISKRFSVYLNGTPIDLGIIYLERDIAREQTDNLISLTDGDLSDDFESVSSSMGLLQSTRDVFLNRAAFDFGQAFLRCEAMILAMVRF